MPQQHAQVAKQPGNTEIVPVHRESCPSYLSTNQLEQAVPGVGSTPAEVQPTY